MTKTTVFKKVQIKKVYMEIVRQILDSIQQGKLKQGDKLPTEQTLAHQFGSSRPTVREALSALEILDIIESKPGKGNFIRGNPKLTLHKQRIEELENEKSPFELLEARKTVEPEVAELAAHKATNEDIAAVQRSLDKMKATMSILEAMEFDREFHVNISRATHNTILLSIMAYLAEGLKEDLWTNLKEKTWSIPGLRQEYLEEHAQIFNAIKNRDGTKAFKSMYNHLARVQDNLLIE